MEIMEHLASSDEDEVASLEKALAAVRTAAQACSAFGGVAAIRGGADDGKPVMEVAVCLFESALADARRRALPLEFGGEVLIVDPYDRNARSRPRQVIAVRRGLVYLSDGRGYEIASGSVRGIGSDTIIGPDLDRVRRDLAKKKNLSAPDRR